MHTDTPTTLYSDRLYSGLGSILLQIYIYFFNTRTQSACIIIIHIIRVRVVRTAKSLEVKLLVNFDTIHMNIFFFLASFLVLLHSLRRIVSDMAIYIHMYSYLYMRVCVYEYMHSNVLNLFLHFLTPFD